MDYKTLSVTYEGHLAIVTLNYPPVNSITAQLMDELEAAFDELAAAENLRAVLLISALEKIFVAGADINQFVNWNWPTAVGTTKRGHVVFGKIADFDKPVICVINGGAFGGGLELAMACDMRVISKKAKVGLPETGLGVMPGYGGTQRLPRLVGPGMAKKLILTGAIIGGEEAYRIGLAEVLSEPGECVADAKKLAMDICSKAPLAVTAAKRAVDYAMVSSFEDGSAHEIFSLGVLAESEDKSEGAKAFLEKREAKFEGR